MTETQTEAEGDEDNTGSEPADNEDAGAVRAPVSMWRVSVALMFVFILGYIAFVLWRAAVPAEWEFSIEAETEVAEISLRPQSRTQWQVDGVVICTRGSLALPDDFRLSRRQSPCGSRAWRAWQVPAPEQVLELDGDSAATLTVRPEGGLAMSLRASEGSSLGTLSVVGVVEDIALGDAINLIWTAVPSQALTFPFSGKTTLGRAVGWSNIGMLQSGTVSIYTADESADKRTLVDETTLMLGDQIRLANAKGFAHISADEDVMHIVAFGRAERLRIDRYGESGYEFEPGRFRKLASDPTVAFFGSLLAAYITLVLALQPFVDSEFKGFKKWIRGK